MKNLMLCLVLAGLLPMAAVAQTLDEAARDAARKYDARVLSAHTVHQGEQKVHVIKLITREGVIKTVRVPVRGKGK